jgi:hypothetical protein
MHLTKTAYYLLSQNQTINSSLTMIICTRYLNNTVYTLKYYYYAKHQDHIMSKTTVDLSQNVAQPCS